MVFKYQKTILRKHSENLFECSNKNCGHLRFVGVHWLDEAYSSAIASLDTGAVRRCLSIRKTLYLLLFCIYGFAIKNIKMVDYGGGAGLLSRLLRDVGVDCYSYDKYAGNVYCSAFNAERGKYDAMSMIEVAEHLENPVEEFSSIIENYAPNFIFISTQLFDENTPEDWWYFTPTTGQHISFFTRKSMALLASKFGYNVLFQNNIIIWAKDGVKISPLFKFAAIRCLREFIFAAATIINRYSPQRDFELVEGKIL